MGSLARVTEPERLCLVWRHGGGAPKRTRTYPVKEWEVLAEQQEKPK